MFCRVLLMVVCVVCYVEQNKQASGRVAIPTDVHTWCPHTQFCNLKPPEPWGTALQTHEPVLKPCCKSCSCAPTCGLTRNCCRDGDDEHQIDLRVGTVCKLLNSKSFTDRHENSYYIFDRCPDKADSCSLSNGSFWAGYSPVFSPATGRIYYNSHCATCHHQNDTIKFIPTVSCSEIQESVLNLFSQILSGKEVHDCSFKFLVPSHLDLSTEVCYKNVIRECGQKYNTSNIEKLQQLCQSFNATFDSGFNQYGNVYCYLCNVDQDFESRERLLDTHRLCASKGTGKVFGTASLTVLLTESVLDRFTEPVTDTSPTAQTACFDVGRTEKVCHPTHCPEGQFRQGDKCTFFGQTWFVKNAQLYIKLIPHPKAQHPQDPHGQASIMTMTEVLQLMDRYALSNTVDFLTMPSLREWDLKLFYNQNNATIINHLLVVLILKSTIINPQSLLENITKSLQEPWTIVVDSQSFGFRAEFSRYVDYQQINKVGEIVIYPSHLNTDMFALGMSDEFLLQGITGNFPERYRMHRLCITKLFLCQQLELAHGEFAYPEGSEVRVYLPGPDRYLESGEFVVSRITQGTIKTVRVCTEDIYHTASRSAAHNIRPRRTIVLPIFVVLLWGFILIWIGY